MHQIENCFYNASEAPWHGLGKPIADMHQYSIEEALEDSGANFLVEKRKLFLEDGREAPAFCTVRDTDQSILGVVGPNYNILQNHEHIEFFRPFLESKEASFETGGTLFSGRIVWFLAKINRSDIEITQDDIIRKYLLVSNSHDGTQSCRVSFCPTRVVCWNTLQMAFRDKNSAHIRLKHSSSIKENLENIRDVVNLANQEFEATAEQLRRLKRKDISARDVAKYVIEVFRMQDDEGKISTRSVHQLETIVNLFEKGKGNEGKTVYDAYQGITEFLSHRAGRTNETRLNSLWFGANNEVNKRALDLAIQLSA